MIAKMDSDGQLDWIRRIETLDQKCRQAHLALQTPEETRKWGSRVHHLPEAQITIYVTDSEPGRRVGRAYGLGLYGTASESVIDNVLGLMIDERVNDLRFPISQIPQRPEIQGWLLRRDFKRSSNFIQWRTPTTPRRQVDTPYTIETLGSSRNESLGALIAANYHLKEPVGAEFHSRLPEMEGMKCYLTFDQGLAIGTGALYHIGEGCLLEYGSTIGSHRKQGHQCAMIGHRLNEADGLGCTWACSSTMGYDRSSRNLRRQGFEKVYDDWVFRKRVG